MSGQLGMGTAADGAIVPTPITGDLSCVQISVGLYTVCGITADDVTYCWGVGLWGERGDGTTVLEHGSPVKVVTP